VRKSGSVEIGHKKTNPEVWKKTRKNGETTSPWFEKMPATICDVGIDEGIDSDGGLT